VKSGEIVHVTRGDAEIRPGGEVLTKEMAAAAS
jgi:hypothetical protein